MLSSELSLGLPFWQGESISGTLQPYPNLLYAETDPHLKAPCEPEGVCLGPC